MIEAHCLRHLGWSGWKILIIFAQYQTVLSPSAMYNSMHDLSTPVIRWLPCWSKSQTAACRQTSCYETMCEKADSSHARRTYPHPRPRWCSRTETRYVSFEMSYLMINLKTAAALYFLDTTSLLMVQLTSWAHNYRVWIATHVWTSTSALCPMCPGAAMNLKPTSNSVNNGSTLSKECFKHLLQVSRPEVYITLRYCKLPCLCSFRL